MPTWFPELTTATLPLYGGLVVIAIATLLSVYVAVHSTGHRPEVERNLKLLDREIREWTRSKQKVQEQEPLLLQLLHIANPLGRRLVLPNSMRNLENSILYAGNPPLWTLENVLAMKVFSVLGGVLVAAYLLSRGGDTNSLMLALLVAVGAYEIPDLTLSSMASRRQTEIRKALPDMLDLLTVTVEAGLSFDASVAQVAAVSGGPMAGEFYRYLQEKQIGLTSREALEALAARSSVEELKMFCNALLQADRVGIAIGPVMHELTSEMRIKRRQRAQEQAQKVPVKILFPLIFFIFPVFMLVILGPAFINAMGVGFI